MRLKRPDIDIKTLQVWPTHWAGGIDGIRVDGHNTIFLDSNRGEICRFKTEDHGRVTQRMYRVAAAMAALPEVMDLLERFCREGVDLLYPELRETMKKMRYTEVKEGEEA